ncbi:MAG: class I SAM-dependent rRNA methyltransferase [Chlamydiae bacterium]|nr:class I SAM-dependent rRNA methyltransferase [Chlamydiota bacterium]
MDYKKVILHPQKEKAVLNRHHWIFSGAIKALPSFDPGEILAVYSSDNKLLGHGYFNPNTSIAGRMLSFGSTDPLQAVEENLISAINFRRSLFDEKLTNAYRIVNGEGDLLPGLIIDKYDQVLVIQIATLGMEKLKPFILEKLKTIFPNIKAIYEKSSIASRKLEGLEDFEGLLYGTKFDLIEIVENGVKFYVDIVEGQKTGFFLDQREMRKFITEYSYNKKVLNCFCYTGGFSLFAGQNGLKIDSVDSSQKALILGTKNVELNNQNLKKHEFIASDVFDFLKKPLDYDLIILDPPAFAKKQKDTTQAYLGYKELNKLAMKNLQKKGFILTCSCSYFIDEELFQKMIFEAAKEANKKVFILSKHRQALDHPINIFHPEGEYLKSLFLRVE